LPVAICLAGAFVFASCLAVRLGLARIYAGYGLFTNDVTLVDRAVQLMPGDPEARLNRAALLSDSGQHSEASAELERVTQLRPRDYYPWLELGMARDRAGDAGGAERALREAVRLAPYYAQPAWQLGNVLFRQNRLPEALAELKRAAKSDPTFLPMVLELTWAASGEMQAFINAVQPETDFEHLALAKFFAKKGKGIEAVNEFRKAGASTKDDQSEVIRPLLAQKEFAAAYQIWLGTHNHGEATAPAEETIPYDGGFEKALNVGELGFGWQVTQNSAIGLSVDPNAAYEGAKCLRIEYRGESSPTEDALAQLIVVESGAKYRLEFASRVQEIVTGGLPMLIITDATDAGHVLAESPPLGSGNSEWHPSNIEFTTGQQTRAVRLEVRRKTCAGGPCPIFGRLWLDGFSLKKI